MDTSQMLKGVIDVAVLAVVADEDGYGYDVIRRRRAAGLDEVGAASVYGTLRRLFAAGALTSYVVPSDEGPHRKYYGITDHGTEMLGEWAGTWRGFAGAIGSLLERHAEVTNRARRRRCRRRRAGTWTRCAARRRTSRRASATSSASRSRSCRGSRIRRADVAAQGHRA